MRESIGKNTERKIFFEEVLPGGLSPRSIAHGNVLLLLGEEPRELPYTDSLGIPRSNVWSVERLNEIYGAQVNQDLGVHLNYGEMAAFLDNLIQSNQEFLIFKLDVEGSYLSQLDSAMTPVLLLCWRNPETLVGMYSSVGRDTEMLWEGVKSLAIFLWQSKQLTLETFASLRLRYESAGLTQPINMVLRDFFWLRSMLEHTLVASGMVGVAAQKLVHRWFDKMDLLWTSIARWKRRPLRLNSLIEMVDLATEFDLDRREVILNTPSCLGSSLNSLTHVAYNAERPWSQMCWFAKFKVLEEVVNCGTWLREGLTLLLEEPLTFVDRDGCRQEFREHEAPNDGFLNAIIWNSFDLYEIFKPRRLPIYPASERLIAISKNLLASKRVNTFFSGMGKEETMKAKNGTSSPRFVDKDGNVTEFGKQELQTMGRRWKDMATKQIIELLPISARKIPERVVRAHVAVGRRKK
jgi:hypothetical protein